MTSRLIAFWFVLAAVVGAALCGCAGGAAYRDAMVRPPAMPTMARPLTTAQPEISETETLATALRQARNNDFPAALRTIESRHDLSQRARLTREVVHGLADQNPSAAATFAMTLPAGLTQTNAIELAAVALTRQDPDTGFRWAVSIADPIAANIARRSVMTELMRANPRAAIDRVMALPSGAAREDTLGIAAAAWARVDPDAAISWLGELPNDELKQRLTSSIGFEVALKTPERAIMLAESLPAGRNRWLLFAAITQTWVAVNPNAALTWARQLPTGEARDAAFAGVDTGLGVPASRRIASAPGSGAGSRVRSGGVSIASSWPGISSPEFEAWLKTQSPGLTRDEAILEYVRQRGASDTGALGQWIASLPGSPTRDRALQIYLDNLLVASPGDAANWLRSLPRSDRSDELIEKTARRWLLTNPEMAEAWLRETPLLPQRKAELLREAGR